jgi:hypothetical protein
MDISDPGRWGREERGLNEPRTEKGSYPKNSFEHDTIAEAAPRLIERQLSVLNACNNRP